MLSLPGFTDNWGLRRLEIDSRKERSLLNERLVQAADWSEQRCQISDPSFCLRSEPLRPSLVLGEDFPRYSWDYKANPLAEVETLVNKRTELMRAHHHTQADTNPSSTGRLLLYYPHETLSDGAAWQITSGYFDDWNMPPWDTWIWYGQMTGGEYLLSWVPGPFVELVSAGIWANPEECIQWLRPDFQKSASNTRPATADLVN